MEYFRGGIYRPKTMDLPSKEEKLLRGGVTWVTSGLKYDDYQELKGVYRESVKSIHGIEIGNKP